MNPSPQSPDASGPEPTDNTPSLAVGSGSTGTFITDRRIAYFDRRQRHWLQGSIDIDAYLHRCQQGREFQRALAARPSTL